MHDDVPYGEGTSYTQGTGIAINNNVIAVDADNTPTENSEKPVKSKGVYSALESYHESVERELTEAVDEFTTPSVSPVNGVVTFSDLNPDYGYKLFVDIPDETSSLPTNLTDLPVCKWTKVQRSTKADGTITLAYTVTNINVNYCLRILK